MSQLVGAHGICTFLLTAWSSVVEAGSLTAIGTMNKSNSQPGLPLPRSHFVMYYDKQTTGQPVLGSSSTDRGSSLRH